FEVDVFTNARELLNFGFRQNLRHGVAKSTPGVTVEIKVGTPDQRTFPHLRLPPENFNRGKFSDPGCLWLSCVVYCFIPTSTKGIYSHMTTQNSSDARYQEMRDLDPEVYAAINGEIARQRD